MLLAKTDRISFVFFFLAQDLILFLSWFKSSMPLLKSVKIVIEYNYLEIRVTWYLIRIYWPWIWLMSVSGLSDTSRYRLSSQNWVSNEYCRGTFIVKNKQVCQKKSILCKAFRGATSKQGKVVTTFNPYKVEILLSFRYLLLFDTKLLHGLWNVTKVGLKRWVLKLWFPSDKNVSIWLHKYC